MNILEAVFTTIAEQGPIMGKALAESAAKRQPATASQIDIAIGELAGSNRITWADKGWVKR